MSYNSHLAVNIAEARSIGAGTEANPSDHPYTASGTAETTNESPHGQGSRAALGALARILYLFTAILYTLWLAVHFFVRMVETGRFFDASGFFTYLGIVLALCAAALLVGVLYADPSPPGSYMWSISDALRGMLANDMVIAIFAVAQSLVNIPSRNMVLVVSGSEEHAGPVPFSRFCQAISATLQGIPPTVSQWVSATRRRRSRRSSSARQHGELQAKFQTQHTLNIRIAIATPRGMGLRFVTTASCDDIYVLGPQGG